MTTTVVHKFGGTSLADAACVRRVAEIIAARPERRRIVVVSAMAGVTNALVRAVELASARDPDGYRGLLADLERKHREAFAELVPSSAARELGDAIDKDLAEIRDVLHATTLLRRLPQPTGD